MSKYRIATLKQTKRYEVQIDTETNIDFSATTYDISVNKPDTTTIRIELTPNDINILHEVTDIFPLTEYNIKIMQNIYPRINLKPHISLYLDIINKTTNETIYIADSVIISDTDYDYILDLFKNQLPQYEWQTAEQYLRHDIESFIGDYITDNNILTYNSRRIIKALVANRYQELKTPDLIDFDDYKAKTIVNYPHLTNVRWGL